MLSFNALLRAAIDVHHAELRKSAMMLRGAFHIDKPQDFESFLTAMSDEEPEPQKGSDINALMRDVGSF